MTTDTRFHTAQRPPQRRRQVQTRRPPGPNVTAFRAALEHEHDERFEEGFEEGFESGIDHAPDSNEAVQLRLLRSINAWVIYTAVFLTAGAITAYVTWMLVWPF